MSFVHLLIRNIPSSFHSADLRRFFSEFLETERIRCFHFRHRPEIKKKEEGQTDEISSSSSTTRCCIIKVDQEHEGEFRDRYHTKHWTDKNGEEISSRCLISVMKPSEEGGKVTEGDLREMPELRPPGLMPWGNVGTPTQYFLKAVQQCRLPPKIISKLQLEFPRSRRRRIYGDVQFDYGETSKKGMKGLKRSNQEKKKNSDQLAKAVYVHRKKLSDLNSKGPQMEKDGKDGSGSDDDDDTCEEWERHESLHNDVAARRVDPTDISQQPGTKERLFEEEMEVTWDKGSSGLVFYTDAQYWKEQEGDFDERTTDDWDVDMAGYYGGRCDEDARDSIQMRKSDRYKQGVGIKSAFNRKRGDDDGDGAGPSGSKIGRFEKHTKGFGRRIMESQGWKDGQGLGDPKRDGLKDALDNDGQTDKAGLGYRGEVVPRFVSKATPGRKRESIRDVIISTTFDKPEETDPGESLMRKNPQNYLSHRK